MRNPEDIIHNGKSLAEWLEINQTESADLRGAKLREAKLREADLRKANMQGADLREANMRGAKLREADMREADMRVTDLRGADMRGAKLREADMRGADMRGADMREADMRGADLREADVLGADLRGAKNIPDYLVAITNIAPEGDLIGWKKTESGGGAVIVKLKIPAKYPRSNASGRKCRAGGVRVLAQYLPRNNTPLPDDFLSYTDDYGPRVEYRVGKTVLPDKWDDDRWAECSNGIHFFLTRYEAEQY